MTANDLLALLSLLMMSIVAGWLALIVGEWLLLVAREVVAEIRYQLAWRRYEKGTRG